MGKKEVPQSNIGVVLPGGTVGGNGWRAGQAQTTDVFSSATLPRSTPTSGSLPSGATVLPTSSWPSQGGTGRENLTPLAHLPWPLSRRSFLIHTLCLCLHRNFSLLIYMETPER